MICGVLLLQGTHWNCLKAYNLLKKKKGVGDEAIKIFSTNVKEDNKEKEKECRTDGTNSSKQDGRFKHILATTSNLI